MSRKAGFLIFSLILLLAIAIWQTTTYYENLPERVSQHETIVLGRSRFAPGSQGALRVVVRDTKDAAPLEGAAIYVSLAPPNDEPPIPLFSGVTDSQGSANVSFTLPEDPDPNQTLIVETVSDLGSDRVERAVTIERDYRVLLTTDKPLYQPGQVIHLRALALSAFDLTPAANQALELVIADGKGNKVYRQTLTTSDFGVAAADFQLATQVNTGNYKLSAVLGNTSSEKTVTVEHYVLPKFSVDIAPDQAFYMPGDTVSASLDARYFFGKPVAEGEILIEGFTYDVEKNTAFTLQGTTGENGRFDFDFKLPDFIAGTDLEGGLGRFYLQASVTDQADQTETSNLSIPIAGSALVVEAIPEGGRFRPNVENILYVLTSYPDGSPAETTLEINLYDTGERLTVETGGYGLAEVPVVPNSPYMGFSVFARDARGASTEAEFYFEGEWFEETVLLRPDRPIYRVGETMNLTVLTSVQQGTVYLDIVREGQTISTRAVDVENGSAQIAVDLTPDLYGTLELHAYKILRSGQITRDTRLVIVDQAADLNLSLTPGEEVYRPGEDATLNIGVTGQDGAGVPSSVGLAIVDESVFALAAQDPGFAKLYFMLEQELLQPKYDLHGFSIPDLVNGVPVSAEPFVGAIEDAAQASLAEATPQQSGFSIQANSHDDALQSVYDRQRTYFANLSKGLFAGLIVLPLAAVVMNGMAVQKQKKLGRSLGLSLIIIAGIALVLTVWPHPWANGPLEKLGLLIEWMMYDAEAFLAGLALLGIVIYFVLAFLAWRRKDSALGWSLLIIPLFALLLFSALDATDRAGIYPDDTVSLWGLLAFLLLPLSFLLRSAGFGLEHKITSAVSAGIFGLFLMFGILPLVGVSSRSMVAMDGMVVEEMVEAEVMFEAPMEAGAVMAMDDASDTGAEVTQQSAGSGESAANEPPRLRQYFPETMLWLPEIETDQNGQASIEFPVADSITTWRLTALASSQDGRLGSATGSLVVFQDFFIDLDLPLFLTVGDEVSVPVGVFNYLEEAQSVRLELESAPWFELLDDAQKTIEIAGNDITVVYFRVRALDFGTQSFQVTAIGSSMSDAILKSVRVFPDGKQVYFTQSDRLAPDMPASYTVNIPTDAVAGTQELTVKIYPGILSQVVEGLEGILRMPYGCFEQTSSTTYPNVLVLDYLKTTNQAAPEVQFTAEEYINLGYQRLTTFEVGGSGGFSLFGDPPPDRMLTAYGLQEFADMSRVHSVDPDLVRRAAEWVFSQQASDGSWENDQGLVHESTWSNLGNDRLPVTAYIVWSLADAGYADDGRTLKGLAYIKENQAEADDPYVVALVANALVAADLNESGEISSVTASVLDRLAGLATQDGSGAIWQSGVATFMGSEGQTGSIETTALAALALLRAQSHPDLANAALTTLIQQKDSFGTWYSTQATVLSLKALIESVRAGAEDVDAEVTVTLNDGQTRSVRVNAENFDVVQMLTFDDVNIGRENVVDIRVEGKGNLMYQVAGSYYLPWDKLVEYPEIIEPQDLVDIQVSYDRTELAVNETVEVEVTVTLNEGRADWALIDLGIPPGFAVETAGLDALVNRYLDTPEDYEFPTVERYELTGRQVLVYIGNLSAEHPLTFTFELRAKYPLTAQTPASTAYDYYNPEVSGDAPPEMIVVVP